MNTRLQPEATAEGIYHGFMQGEINLAEALEAATQLRIADLVMPLLLPWLALQGSA